MVFWIILAVLIGILVLVLLIPVGIDFRYEEDIVRFSLKVAWKEIQLIPKKKKSPDEEKPNEEKKPKKEKKPEEETSPEDKKKLSLPFNTEEIFELLKVLINSFGSFCGKVSVDRFVLHWICPSWNNPYLSARIFSVVNAGMSQLAPVCSDRFHCRDSSVWTDIDFAREVMFFEFGLTFTIRIGKIIGTALEMGFAVIRIYLRSRRRVKREEKEEQQALEAWLREHPEDRPALEEQTADLAS